MFKIEFNLNLIKLEWEIKFYILRSDQVGFVIQRRTIQNLDLFQTRETSQGIDYRSGGFWREFLMPENVWTWGNDSDKSKIVFIETCYFMKTVSVKVSTLYIFVHTISFTRKLFCKFSSRFSTHFRDATTYSYQFFILLLFVQGVVSCS